MYQQSSLVSLHRHQSHLQVNSPCVLVSCVRIFNIYEDQIRHLRSRHASWCSGKSIQVTCEVTMPSGTVVHRTGYLGSPYVTLQLGLGIAIYETPILP